MGLLDDEEFLRSQMRATPRNQLLGLLSDVIAKGYSPERTQQMQGLSKFLGAQEVSQTLDRLSYGEPLTTGAGGIGGTTRVRPEALDAAMAAMNLAPLVGPTARVAGKAAMMAGKSGERFAERVVPQIMDRGGLAAEMLGAMGSRTISPLDVYHGTPHTLPPTPRNPLGEFDASKIGTGEGAQAYGQGIYTAEGRPVAEAYASKLSNPVISFANKKPTDAIEKSLLTQYEKLASRTEANYRGQAVDELWNIHANPPHHQLYGMSDILKPLSPERLTERLEVINAAKRLGRPSVGDSGNLYKVDLPDEMIAKMLDWDKPLSQQSESVKKALSADKRAKDSLYQNAAEYYRALTSQYAQNAPLHYSVEQAENFAQQFASQKLREMGIPGIKYLDATSRDAGKGTRNFVTFPGEEKKMTILERNGQGLTPALLPQQLALELAQQRAALPVSKGGLGLPADNTAQQRAAAMGINVETNYIHSTNRPFNQITDDGKFSGIFTLPNYSSNYGLIDMPLVTGEKIATTQDLQNLIKNPTKKIQRAIDETIPLNLTDPTDIADATVEMQKLRNQLAKKYGFDGVKISDEFGNDTVALVNPDNIRSRFAAFDPFRRTAATAALMGVAAPDLLASEITDEEKKRQLAGLLYP